MLNKMCIRDRIFIIIIMLLLISSTSIMVLLNRVENKLYNSNMQAEIPFSYNYYLGMVLTGDIQSGFLWNKGYPILRDGGNSDKLFELIRTLKIQVMSVFGITFIIGILMAMYTSSRIANPIKQLAIAANGVANGNLIQTITPTGCSELRMLARSYEKMQEGLLEYEEEKNRLNSVEITKNLAAGIAHEIKNPINTVGLIADYLQTNLSPDNPEKRYEFYKLSENMKNELKRINHIVEGFLRLTKPDFYNFTKEDINAIIQNTLAILEPEIVKQNIHVYMDLDTDTPLIKADRDRLKQVFLNLILNAVEAIPRGGDINLCTEFHEGIVKISVSDNGIGIEKKDLKNIFDPYYSTKEQGFGLGLSLIQTIVHKHRGKIRVSSEKGKGTDVVILLSVDFSDE
jgi:signal transduction histidine kinase